MIRRLAQLFVVFALCACTGKVTGLPDGGIPDGGLLDGGRPDGGWLDGGPLDAGPVTPTVSAWLGTNVGVDLPRVDISHQLAPFDTAASQKDADGYPVAGASGTSSTDIGFVLPSGSYAIAYVGTGSLTVSGIGRLVGPWTQAGGEQRARLDITGTPGAFGNFLTLQIANGAGQTVSHIRILLPGQDLAGSPPLFNPQFLRLLKPFRALRFMDWEKTNGSTVASWADRPTATRFGESPNGEPWEHIVELINQTGKDGWVTVPEHADDAYALAMAQFLRGSLDFARIDAARASQGFTTPWQLIVEDSNETWNNGFTAYATLLAIAQADPSRFDGRYTGSFGPSWMTGNTALMQVAQVHGDRVARFGTLFRQAFGDHASAVKTVLSGWALGPAFSDASLQFIAAHHGTPSDFVSYVAIAPYFATADDTTTGSLATIFPAMQQNIQSMAPALQDFARFGAASGIPIIGYEGGQSLVGTTNQTVKHLAQSDARMHQTYAQYLGLWKQTFGNALFMHFSLTGTLGLPEFTYQYGYWGSIASAQIDPATCGQNLPTLTGTEAPQSQTMFCPKYQALAEQVP
jgi:hypothetical protein